MTLIWLKPPADDVALQDSEQNEHDWHKSRGDMFTWCRYCRWEEICDECSSTGFKEGIECFNCEGTGRKIKK